jgi:hypothetical protein
MRGLVVESTKWRGVAKHFGNRGNISCHNGNPQVCASIRKPSETLVQWKID